MFWLILLLILIYFIAAPIFKVWRKVRKFQDQYYKTMNGDQDSESGGTSTGSNRTAKEREMVERYRRYIDETAQNVDYEELDGRMSSESPQEQNAQQEPSTTKYQEEVISDVEFEEVKEG